MVLRAFRMTRVASLTDFGVEILDDAPQLQTRPRKVKRHMAASLGQPFISIARNLSISGCVFQREDIHLPP